VEVERSPISGNLDAPEGGFDAIMQAIACKVIEFARIYSLSSDYILVSSLLD